MGGNVFKNEFEVVRLEHAQYYEICREFHNFFGPILSSESESFSSYSIIPSYRLKDSFGDMDVLYSNKQFYDLAYDFLVQEFGKEKVSKNTNVISFLYNPLGYGDFQVDLIYMDEANFFSSLDYYSFNDLGNLRGRISHMLGLKLGHDGLKYIHREGDQVCFEIELSKNLYEIEKFLGFDEKRTKDFYSLVPDTLNDIFEYVASSKYFNPDIYLLHNRNHQSRIRDKKRKTYTEFLKWCDSLPKDLNFFKKPENKAPYQLQAIMDFGKLEEFKMKLEVLRTRKEVKKRYNGNFVMETIGLTGKELGNFMSFLDHHFCDGLILGLKQDTLASVIRDLYEVYENEK